MFQIFGIVAKMVMIQVPIGDQTGNINEVRYKDAGIHRESGCILGEQKADALAEEKKAGSFS